MKMTARLPSVIKLESSIFRVRQHALVRVTLVLRQCGMYTHDLCKCRCEQNVVGFKYCFSCVIGVCSCVFMHFFSICSQRNHITTKYATSVSFAWKVPLHGVVALLFFFIVHVAQNSGEREKWVQALECCIRRLLRPPVQVVLSSPLSLCCCKMHSVKTMYSTDPLGTL